jgi:sugar phosphate permease
MSGLLLALSSVGGMIGQTPLAVLAEARGWRWCFYGIGIIGGALSLICLFFARGNPVARG